MTRSEHKLREAVLASPDPDSGSGEWEGDFSGRDGPLARDGSSVTAIDGSAGAASVTGHPVHGPVNGSVGRGSLSESSRGEGDAGTGKGQEMGSDAHAPDAPHGPHQVNQSLARLEMNSLQVKLYLDSIDQRISRMEPRLEGMRGAEQEPAARKAGDAVEGVSAGERVQAGRSRSAGDGRAAVEERSATPAEVALPILPTTERRRRAQGVPVERRRAPHTVPGEVEEGETWAWEWKPWIEEGKAWLLAHRAWAPAAVLGVLTLAGLVYWSTARDVSPQSRAADASGVISGAAVNGAGKSSPEMLEIPGAAGPGSTQGRGVRPGGANRVAEARSGRTIVEQGVAVPVARGASALADSGQVAPAAANSGPANVDSGSAGSLNGGAAGSPNSGIAMNPNSTGLDPALPRAGANAPGGSAPASGLPGDVDSANSSVSEPNPSRPAAYGRIIPPSANRVQVSSGVMAGSLIYSRPPTYPRGFARLFHSQGRVVMQAIISKSGRVENLRVISGHYMLRGAAKDAVRTWRYKPYHVNGNAVEVATIVSVEFQR